MLNIYAFRYILNHFSRAASRLLKCAGMTGAWMGAILGRTRYVARKVGCVRGEHLDCVGCGDADEPIAHPIFRVLPSLTGHEAEALMEGGARLRRDSLAL